MKEIDQKKCYWCEWENATAGGCVMNEDGSGYEGDKEELGGSDCPGYEKCSINKYGLMHKTFLEENAPFVFETLFLNNELEERLMRVSKTASQRMSDLMNAALKTKPIPEDGNILEIAGYKQNLRDSLEEMVLKELVYNDMPFGGICKWKLEN